MTVEPDGNTPSSLFPALPSSRPPGERLDRISTEWSRLDDPAHFVIRYAPAVQKYLGAILRDPADAEEVAQEFVLKVVEKGFGHARPDGGRFRDYLKASLRNAALTHLRKRTARPAGDSAILDELPAPPAEAAADAAWLAEWRGCLLERAWHALDAHQRGSPGNLFYTVLRLTVDHPGEDSPALAARAATESGRPLKPDAFRKQLSRARQCFADLLVREVAQTVEPPSPERVAEELTELGLMEYVRDYLPGAGGG
jgi:Sigma-70 region 2